MFNTSNIFIFCISFAEVRAIYGNVAYAAFIATGLKIYVPCVNHHFAKLFYLEQLY